MSDEAEEYLRRYLADAKPRLRWLREHASATGGPEPAALDFSRDSLGPLWTWAVRRFRLRPAGEALVPEELPIWFGRRPIQRPTQWSDETILLADALMYYLAECVMRAVPDAHWVVGHSSLPNYLDENQPVLAGFAAPLDVVLPTQNLIANSLADPASPLKPKPVGVDDLQKLLDIFIGQAAPPASLRSNR
jgi:hypothetical protein